MRGSVGERKKTSGIIRFADEDGEGLRRAPHRIAVIRNADGDRIGARALRFRRGPREQAGNRIDVHPGRRAGIDAEDQRLPTAAYPGENDTIELVETNFAMNFAATPKPVATAKVAESQSSAFFGRRTATGGTRSLDKTDPPKSGDSWTYRFSDGYAKSGSFTVRITGVSAEEITDEARMGNNRHAGSFAPGLALSGRSFAGTTVREISPYLQSLGSLEATADWNNVSILSNESPFTARLAGTETVTVPADRYLVVDVYILVNVYRFHFLFI